MIDRILYSPARDASVFIAGLETLAQRPLPDAETLSCAGRKVGETARRIMRFGTPEEQAHVLDRVAELSPQAAQVGGIVLLLARNHRPSPNGRS